MRQDRNRKRAASNLDVKCIAHKRINVYQLNRIGHLRIGYRCGAVRQTAKPEMIQLRTRELCEQIADGRGVALHSARRQSLM